MARHDYIIVSLFCLTACANEGGELDIMVSESPMFDASLAIDAALLSSDSAVLVAPLDVAVNNDDLSMDLQVALDQNAAGGSDLSLDMMSDPPNPDVGFNAIDSGALNENVSFTCPELPAVDECLFGLDTRRLLEDNAFTIELVDRYFDSAPLSDLERLAFVRGFECGGLFEPSNADEAFGLIDSDGLRRYRVSHVESEQDFDWYRFYMGDTEVGYLYMEASLSMVGIISDGDINRCQLSK